MKKFSKLLLLCATLLMLFTLLSAPVSALTESDRQLRTYYGAGIYHKLSGGVGNSGYNTRYYWVSSTATTYNTLITSAMSSWNTTVVAGITTKIWFVKTTTQSSSVMDIHVVAAAPGNSGAAAETKFFSTSGESSEVSPYGYNWVWGKIMLYSSSFGNFSPYNKEGTICHEMGHVLGLCDLAYKDSGTSIMVELGYGRTTKTPNSNDYQLINFLYP